MLLLAKEIRHDLFSRHKTHSFVCTSEDNVNLHGLFIERANPRTTLLLCHGYQCCKELNAGYIDMFPDDNIITFDFRAHGENKRSITTIGCHEYKDVIAVAKWFQEAMPMYQDRPLVILGISMGGAAALKAVYHEPALCKALIIDSSFASLKSVLYHAFVNKSGLPTFPFLPIMEKMFNFVGSCNINTMKPIDCIQSIQQPIMLIHSCIDHLVPVQESLLMYAQAEKMGAKLWIGPECPHGWLHKKYPELYKKKINSFLRKQVHIE